jgi:hypothetical protein
MLKGGGGGKKEEGHLSGGYSGKTQAILRDAIRKAEVGLVKPPATFGDGEHKRPVAFHVEGPEACKTWVAHAKLEDPMVVQAQVDSHAPLTAALPDLARVPKDAPSVMAAIRAHQDAIVLDMVQREAGREGARRQLLHREFIPWRREQMEKAFEAQRTAAHEHLKATMARFDKEVEVFRSKFSAMAASAQRVEDIQARKAAAERAEEEGGTHR